MAIRREMVDEARQELGERVAHGVRADTMLLGEFLHLRAERLLNLGWRNRQVLPRTYPRLHEVAEPVLLERLDEATEAAALA